MTKGQLKQIIKECIVEVLNESFDLKNIKFDKDGRFKTKYNGCKITIIDKLNNDLYKNRSDLKKYPYSLELAHIGQRDCEDLDDVVAMINKYC